MCYRVYTVEEQDIINSFKKKNDHVCFYCNKEITNVRELSVDHVIPICRGGQTIEENLVISCVKCNKEKADMSLSEYKKFLVLKNKLQQVCKEFQDYKDKLQDNRINTTESQIEKIINSKKIHIFNYPDGTEEVIDINKIKIRDNSKSGKPTLSKIITKVEYLETENQIERPLVLTKDYELENGYINYLILKKLNKKAPVKFITKSTPELDCLIKDFYKNCNIKKQLAAN